MKTLISLLNEIIGFIIKRLQTHSLGEDMKMRMAASGWGGGRGGRRSIPSGRPERQTSSEGEFANNKINKAAFHPQIPAGRLHFLVEVHNMRSALLYNHKTIEHGETVYFLGGIDTFRDNFLCFSRSRFFSKER